MNILMTGGTGFIGTELCQYLKKQNHQITIKTRQPSLLNFSYRAIESFDELSVEDKFDVVINLAGEPIADKRWTNRQKLQILSSRLDATRSLMAYLKITNHKPKVLINGSAIGFYGIDSNSDTTEVNGKGDGSFASSVCAQWESVATEAESIGVRTCLLRFGIVLGKKGGALKKMLPAFKAGLGGQIGSGSQWMSWVHINDVIRIIDTCISDEKLTGPINCTAPSPVTNKNFTYALGKTLHRRTLFKVPSFILTAILGDMGHELLLKGKKVLPNKLMDNGFEFNYKRIDIALDELL